MFTVERMTEPQRNYLLDLIRTRDIEEHYRRTLERRVTDWDVTKSLASEWITRLKQKPRRTEGGKAQAEQWVIFDVKSLEQSIPGEELWVMVPRDHSGEDIVVPRGSYALPTPNNTNEISFYSVWINDEGTRWSVKQYLSDLLTPLPRASQYKILHEIGNDPAEAAARYGHEIGRCGVCHRKLTNDVSRESGIGPVCAERWGW